MYDFTYHRPNSLADAAKALSGADAKIIAGGMTLVPTMKQPSSRVSRPTVLQSRSAP